MNCDKCGAHELFWRKKCDECDQPALSNIAFNGRRFDLCEEHTKDFYSSAPKQAYFGKPYA